MVVETNETQSFRTENGVNCVVQTIEYDGATTLQISQLNLVTHAILACRNGLYQVQPASGTVGNNGNTITLAWYTALSGVGASATSGLAASGEIIDVVAFGT